jgi:hypothetical protein
MNPCQVFLSRPTRSPLKLNYSCVGLAWSRRIRTGQAGRPQFPFGTRWHGHEPTFHPRLSQTSRTYNNYTVRPSISITGSLDIVHRIPKRTQRFGDRLCFPPQVKRWEGIYSVASVIKRKPQKLVPEIFFSPLCWWLQDDFNPLKADCFLNDI